MTYAQFSEHFSLNYKDFLLFAYKLTKSNADAKDLVQDSALKAFKKKSQLESSDKFKAWFSKLMYHSFISNYNRFKRRSQLLNINGTHHTMFFNKITTHNSGLENLKFRDIVKVSKDISPKFNRPFEMHFKGYSYKEISTQLNVPVGTIKSRINTARTKIKSRLEIQIQQRA
jgi:RNA polymerase sigma-70 factor (ECF subfamily)